MFPQEEGRKSREREQEDSRRRKEDEEQEQKYEQLLKEACDSYKKKLQATYEMRISREWIAQCDALLARQETTTPFPDLPFWPCLDPECRGDRSLQACEHTMERLYQACEVDYKGLFKHEFHKWHLNRIPKYPEPFREYIKSKSTELFSIIQTVMGGG